MSIVISLVNIAILLVNSYLRAINDIFVLLCNICYKGNTKFLCYSVPLQQLVCEHQLLTSRCVLCVTCERDCKKHPLSKCKWSTSSLNWKLPNCIHHGYFNKSTTETGSGKYTVWNFWRMMNSKWYLIIVFMSVESTDNSALFNRSPLSSDIF